MSEYDQISLMDPQSEKSGEVPQQIFKQNPQDDLLSLLNGTLISERFQEKSIIKEQDSELISDAGKIIDIMYNRESLNQQQFQDEQQVLDIRQDSMNLNHQSIDEKSIGITSKISAIYSQNLSSIQSQNSSEKSKSINNTLKQILNNIQLEEIKEETPSLSDISMSHQSIYDQKTESKTNFSEQNYIQPHAYQMKIYEEIEAQWFPEIQLEALKQPKYGSIVFMPTGSGKTLIAIMTILKIFNQYDYREHNGRIRQLSPEEIHKKHDESNILTQRKQKVAFIVPTTNLVDQQSESINRLTNLKVGKFSGSHQKSLKQVPGLIQAENWRNQMKMFDVFVFCPKKLYDIMTHGLVKIEEFDLLIFDECHHTDQYHLYNLIMIDFFFYKYDESTKRPFILGLTASPLKSKFEDSANQDVSSQIKLKMQSLSNNLYSKFIFISQNYVDMLEKNQASVDVTKYAFELAEKIKQIEFVADKLIKELLKLIPLDSKTMKLQYANLLHEGQQQIFQNLVTSTDPCKKARDKLNSMSYIEQQELQIDMMVYNQFIQQQDDQIVKFMKKRYEMISLDINYVKSNINLLNFKNMDDKILMIYCIILLKNANNLILELGPYSFQTFIRDTENQLIKYMSKKDLKGAWAKDIINEYMILQNKEFFNNLKKDPDKINDLRKEIFLLLKTVSNKVQKIISILNEYKAQKNKTPKVIIFVKDRVVADYLNRIFQRHLEIQQENPDIEKQISGFLHKDYRVSMAMSPKGKNFINQAYKATKKMQNQQNLDDLQIIDQEILSLSELDNSFDSNLSENTYQSSKKSITSQILEFRNMLSEQGSSNLGSGNQSAKITSNKLKEVLANFKKGTINVLIATNVIEEGLDVSECNLVICVNELVNVKAFIQMKGRARQKDSNFIFLCADGEAQQTEKERRQFGVVIEKMKELAFKDDKSFERIEPDPDVIKKKKSVESEFFVIEKTGARVSLRDSKDIIDLFCKAANHEALCIQQNNNGDISLTNLDQKKKISQHVKDFEPNYKWTETPADTKNKKFFLTVLYMPKSCGKYLNEQYRFLPLHGLSKKKDSENHVAQLAIKKLYENQYFDDYLFPCIGEWSNSLLKNHSRKGIIVDSEQSIHSLQDSLFKAIRINIPVSNHSQNYQIKQLSMDKIDSSFQMSILNQSSQQSARITKHISQQELNDFKNDQKSFDKYIKKNKSKILNQEEETYRSLVSSELKIHFQSKVYIHCLQGSDEEKNSYPFKNSNDFIGILYDRKIEAKSKTRFWMFQEAKQKQKNREYLQMLRQFKILEQKECDDIMQDNDKIQLELNNDNAIEYDFQLMNEDEKQKLLEKTKFFHTWLFYYYFSADHLFIKNILKFKFDFLSLFKEELDYLYQNYKHISKLKSLYSPQSQPNKFFQKYQQKYQDFKGSKKIITVFPFIIPLIKINQKLTVNLKLIDSVIKHIKKELIDITYFHPQKLEIENLKHSEKFKDSELGKMSELGGIWDDKFTCIRYVKLERFHSIERWDQPILHLEDRSKRDKDFYFREKQAKHSQYNQVVKDYQTINHNDTLLIKKNSGIRQNLDIYSVQKYNYDKYNVFLQIQQSQMMNIVRKERHFVDFSKVPKSDNIKQNEFKSKKEEDAIDQQISSKFDVVDQLIEKSPLSYDQYQVFLQSCTHILYFNEYLQVEKFILDKLGGYCFLQKKIENNHQIIQQNKKNFVSLTNLYEPSPESRNVFLNPDKQNPEKKENILAIDQMLRNIDIIMEALTAPNANRNYDYERLEFYGDSVISFLVILELFLTKEYSYKEGSLDQFRIQQVSNMHFFRVNIKQEFFKYMIHEPQTIFNDFVPGAFSNLKYQERIKHKSLNELISKTVYLRKQFIYVQYLLENLNQFDQNLMNRQFVTQLRVYYTQYTIDQKENITSYDEDQIYCKRLDQNQFQVDFDWKSDQEVLNFYKQELIQTIERIENDVQNKKRELNENRSKYKGRNANQGKQFFFKQLADIVESVAGASLITCGLNYVQNYLRKIDVLHFSQDELKQKLFDLKNIKENNKRSQNFVSMNYNKKNKQLQKVETIIGYTFKNKLWLIEALSHKSYIDQGLANEDSIQNELNDQSQGLNSTINMSYSLINKSQQSLQNVQNPEDVQISKIDDFDDYERLEFLGDAILNFLIAEYFFKKTVNDEQKKNPKELHKMKTSVVNNALLSLIVIENGLHEYVIYNEKALSQKEQFENYVKKVRELLQEKGGSTIEAKKALDLDILYEHSLKIFGDIFESLVGAIFIDSESIDQTWEVLFRLIEPYIEIYSNLETLQDHSRTKLLELWNSKDYMKKMKCHHETRSGSSKKKENEDLMLPEHNNYTQTCTIFRAMVDKTCVLEVPFDKDAKNKVRSFYRIYFEMMSQFFDLIEKQKTNNYIFDSKIKIIEKINEFRKTFKLS